MWIERDLSALFHPYAGLEAAVVLGPRQVGKTSLLTHIVPSPGAFVPLDDLQLRSRAQRDPALLLADRSLPLIFDEFQYAPPLLPELKLRIDNARRGRLAGTIDPPSPMFLLSGSNQIDVEQALRETLAGRISIFALHGLSVHELLRSNSAISIDEIFWRGGFPELYTRATLNPVDYINDYIATFVEKDIGRSAGVHKLDEFMTVTKLLAARVGNLVDYSSISRDAGVASKTVSEWADVLERARVAFMLHPFSTNLSTRLIKTPKVYFIEPGLVTRLQGHLSPSTILQTPQAGSLFENLVIAEALKTRDHFKRPWNFSFWRTKEQEEIDLIIEAGDRRIFIEAKLAIQGATPIQFSSALRRVFSPPYRGCVVTFGGTLQKLSDECLQVPISDFADYLLQNL